MRDRELAEASDDNFREAWRCLTLASPHGEAVDEGGLLLLSTGAPVAFFNSAFVVDPKVPAPLLVERAIEFFQPRHLPFLVRVRQDVAGDLPAVAQREGLSNAGVLPGMALYPIPDSPPGPMPADLIIRRAEDETTLADHRMLLSVGFGMPPELTEAILSPAILDAPIELYVGYIDGDPVSASALFVSEGGVAGIYNVATPESHRRRGLGEALTWHAVFSGARAGCEVSVLQASVMGQPIYERMGFRVVAPYVTYEADA